MSEMECDGCGRRFKFNEIRQGKCPACRERYAQLRDNAVQSAKTVRPLMPRAAEVEKILLTTETAPDLKITKRIEIITAECAYGMNILKDLFAGVRNIVGGRSEAVQESMRDSRRVALYELKKEAYNVGANAVVGVDLDYVELGATGSTMIMLVASGTAVLIEE